jgi:hypothetical protein
VAAPAGVARAQAEAGCLAVEQQPTSWSTGEDEGGFVLTITLDNTCANQIVGWTLELTLAPNHTVSQGWNAEWSVSGASLTASNLAWNEVLNPGGSTTIGVLGRWVGTFTGPISCTVNGVPCPGQPPANQPPEVTLTSPAEGDAVPIPGTVVLAAEASDPDGAVDRVEFYVGEELVGTDSAAPYQVEVSTVSLGFGSRVASARAVDDGSPPLSTDSEPMTFFVVTVPPVQVIAEPAALEIAAGGSGVVNVRLGVETTVEIEMTVTGDPGITVAPASFTLDSSNWSTGQDVVVSAEAGTAGATATVTASTLGGSDAVAVTVVDGTGS